ncbi:Glycosyl Hydrolase 9 [Hyalella azteca]|uniref:Endoglucanase n=1 Tax=Hyalella azteca TaxID=294128 RepID=A0A6A0H5K0_HYAAZ|nr:Glycosyl Hydrolase 9 [Hyalella azteca]
MSFLFYEAQRSGDLPSSQRVTWRQDSALNDGQDVGVDLAGGYYDAGDHVKFGFPMAFTTTTLGWALLSFKAGFDKAGQTGYAMDAVKWATDYFLKAHSSNMLLYGQVGQGDIDHAYWGRPEDMTMQRPAWKIDTSAPGSDLAADTAAALATASMIFRDSDSGYADRCLAASKDLFEFADQYRQLYHISIPDAAYYYQWVQGSSHKQMDCIHHRSFSGYGDELCMAALFLYQATGDSYYADKAKAFWDEFGVQWSAAGVGYGWDNKFGGAQVLFAEVFGGDFYMGLAKEYIDSMTSQTHTPGGLLYLGEWGSLRSALGVAFIAMKGAQLGIDTSSNRAWALSQIDYALGSTGRSFMVGFGVSPPERPHHRSSSCPDIPEYCDPNVAINNPGPNPQTLYGALVGGPDQNDNYVDDRNDYVQNEVACDYNAGLTGALAAAIEYL